MSRIASILLDAPSILGNSRKCLVKSKPKIPVCNCILLDAPSILGNSRKCLVKSRPKIPVCNCKVNVCIWVISQVMIMSLALSFC